ncbi:MAG: hypothetical protein ACRDRG_21375 [Pseudonocardiaceae bacterium]
MDKDENVSLSFVAHARAGRIVPGLDPNLPADPAAPLGLLMTSTTTAPTTDPEVPSESARRVKPASGGADRVFGLSLRSAGLMVC